MPSAERPARPGRPPRIEYVGEPTRAQIRRKPIWLLALLGCLAVAGVFAWLGQWQMEHAIQEDTNAGIDSEDARPLDSLATPATPVNEAVAGMVVETSGRFAPGDFDIVEQRMNDGELGVWVVGNLLIGAAVDDAADDETDGGADPEAQLSVALGWAEDVEAARAARDALEADARLEESLPITGRYMPADAPVVPQSDDDPERLLSMVPAQLANLWDRVEAPVYAGFLVTHPAESGGESTLAPVLTNAGLDPIDSVKPLPPESINWLNLFYAIEWVVFGGFAIYFWFRLTRDAWERAHELKELQAAGDPPESAGGMPSDSVPQTAETQPQAAETQTTTREE